jgi:metal-responsive CopG/Arc/MetJ family transcriptional regulator
MKKYHRNHEDFRDVYIGFRLTERLSDRLEEAAPTNKSEWVRDAIEMKLKVEEERSQVN